jgi:predicted alpha-1,2-mannosidase
MRSSVVIAVAAACGGQHASLVDPFVGTAGGSAGAPISSGPGNTFPGAVVPWGMVSVSPHDDRAAPAGYRHGAPLLYGFGHVHLSGVGCPELGHVLVSATTGPVERDAATPYRDEAAHPGWYRVELSRYGIVAEATATQRAGMLRFAFPAGDANIVVDASHGAVKSRGGYVRVVSPSELEGEITAGGFCDQHNEHTLWFVIRTSKPALASGTWTDDRAYLRFASAGESIEVAVGVSYVDLDGARENLGELAGWDFDAVRRRAERAWEKALARVEVEGGTAEQQRVFATALYHALLHPNVFSDADGRYRGADGRVHAEGHDRYTVYSLWDTYRTLHPWLSLVYPEIQREMARSLVGIAREAGALPRWELAGADTGVMVGDPATIVLADTYLRGVRDFGVEAAYPTMLRQATEVTPARPGHAALLQHGFIPYDDTGGDWVFGTVSTTLEYELADAALASLARALGRDRDADRLHELSLGYRSLFDPTTGHLRPRNADGSWLSPFDPAATCCDKPWPESGGPGFVEGSAWTYDFAPLHDLDHAIARYGGAEAFAAHLDEHLARHFALGNEPDFATPYLYALAGHPDRTAAVVRALAAQFRDAPDGLPGNDDAGALSAWFVWTALGLYPVRPGEPRYWIGSPLFDRATLHLPGGDFTIVADDNAPDHVYVQSAELDGHPLARAYLDHDELARGGTLHLHMGAQPGPPPWGPPR